MESAEPCRLSQVFSAVNFIIMVFISPNQLCFVKCLKWLLAFLHFNLKCVVFGETIQANQNGYFVVL